MKEKLLTYLKKQGWKVEINQENNNVLPDEIIKRYKNITPGWYEFIKGLNVLMSGDETIWFLCCKDFYEQDENVFQWNEWERISLESAEDDAEWGKAITVFWDSYFPIVLSVKDGYSYYAISMGDGAIVYGSEPEFEECRKIADSFNDFLEMIINGRILR